MQTREPAAPFNEEEMKAVLKLEGSLTKENEKDFYEKCLNYICNNNCDASDVEEVDIFDKYRTL